MYTHIARCGGLNMTRCMYIYNNIKTVDVQPFSRRNIKGRNELERNQNRVKSLGYIIFDLIIKIMCYRHCIVLHYITLLLGTYMVNIKI